MTDLPTRTQPIYEDEDDFIISLPPNVEFFNICYSLIKIILHVTSYMLLPYEMQQKYLSCYLLFISGIELINIILTPFLANTRISKLFMSILIVRNLSYSYIVYIIITDFLETLDLYKNSLAYLSVSFLFFISFCVYVIICLAIIVQCFNQIFKLYSDFKKYIEEEPTLPIVIDDSDNNICSICIEEFKEEDVSELRQLKCSHIYHDKCINLWFEKNNTCPNCREKSFVANV